MSKIKPTTVDEYIDAAPMQAQEKLREIRVILKKIAPNATDTLKWGSPVVGITLYVLLTTMRSLKITCYERENKRTIGQDNSHYKDATHHSCNI